MRGYSGQVSESREGLRAWVEARERVASSFLGWMDAEDDEMRQTNYTAVVITKYAR